MIETKRGYVTKKEVEEYCDIEITDSDEGLERIERAEDIIDKYVGFQNSFLRYDITGKATSGTKTTLTDNSNSSMLGSGDGKYSRCLVQILSGVNEGEERMIISHDSATSTITVHREFSNPIEEGCVYRIYQLAKFPRAKDIKIIDNKIYKLIPEQVKNAVLAQIEYMIEMGDDFFISGTDKDSENIDGYSYDIPLHINRVVAPKAREYLRGIRNIKGNLIV